MSVGRSLTASEISRARKIKEGVARTHPDLKLLLISGYTDDIVVRHDVLAKDEAFLQKPFTPDALARRVREVLDAKKGGG